VYSEVALIAYSPEKNITQKVERARERASNAIETSRKRGIEPVLAVTYYELAEASDSIQSLLYLRYAEEIASIHNYLENQPETPVEIISPQQGGEPKQKTGESLLFLVIGIFIGIGISWIVVRVTR
jgi:predicted S18 family serine protease